MFRLGLAIIFAIVARIQGKKAQRSVSQAYSDLKRHRSFPLLVAALTFLVLLTITGFVLSAVADVWEHANRLGGIWFAAAVLAVLLVLSGIIYFFAHRVTKPVRRRLEVQDNVLFVTSEQPAPLPAPDDTDRRFKRIREALQKATADPGTDFLVDDDIRFLTGMSKHRELIEDELKRHIRNFVDATSSEGDEADQSARRFADKLLSINPGQADWCTTELSALKRNGR
ncbi:MAG: hypothetical protein AAGB04_10450 [Pseudomonadota bacterium]